VKFGEAGGALRSAESRDVTNLGRPVCGMSFFLMNASTIGPRSLGTQCDIIDLGTLKCCKGHSDQSALVAG
jgi:hypothetical protein